MSIEREKRVIAEQGKMDALRARIRGVSFMKTAEVREYLNVSRHTLDAIPFEVLPWVPIGGGARPQRRYHPHDVAAYPARAHRWYRGQTEGREEEVLATMRREMEERDEELLEAAERARRVLLTGDPS